jgi:hypothetical protein
MIESFRLRLAHFIDAELFIADAPPGVERQENVTVPELHGISSVHYLHAEGVSIERRQLLWVSGEERNVNNSRRS